MTDRDDERGVARSEWIWLAAALLLVGLVVAPLFVRPYAILHGDDYRTYDWLEAAKYRSFARDTILRTGQFPLWDPYLEGGVPSYAHPSDGTTSPTFLTSLVFGEALGMKVDLAVLALLGALGLFLVGRRWLALAPPFAAFAAVAFAGGGWAPSGMAVGYYESNYLMLTPLVLVGVHRAAQIGSRRAALTMLLGTAALLTVGGVQMQLCLPFLVIELALWGLLARGLRLPDSGGLFAGVVVVSMLVALFGAYKFLPMMELLSSRFWRVENPLDPVGYFDGVLRPMEGLFMTAQPVGVYDADTAMPMESEYMYGGLARVVAILAPLALLARWRVGLLLLGMTALSFLLGWDGGGGPQFGLYNLLVKLPVFSSVRETTRYVTFFPPMWLALAAAVALQWLWRLPQLVERRKLRWAVVAVVAVQLVPQLLTSAALYRDTFQHEAAPVTERAPVFHQVRMEDYPIPDAGDYNAMLYDLPRRGIGVVYDAEDIPTGLVPVVQGQIILGAFRPPRDNPIYRGEVWVKEGAATLGDLEVPPNTLRFTARVEQDAWIVVNQNWHRDWRSEQGFPVENLEGLLTVRVPAGFDGTVELRFRPRALRLGLAVSLPVWILALLWGGYWWRRRRASGS